MNANLLAPLVHTPFAELDLLFAELDRDASAQTQHTAADEREPDTVDAFNAQILAGLVSP